MQYKKNITNLTIFKDFLGQQNQIININFLREIIFKKR